MPELVYLSTLFYLYSQLLRKERNFKILDITSKVEYLILFISENILCLFVILFLFGKKETTLSMDNINILTLSINYLMLMFIHCLVWRRKDEKFFDPMITNNWWNILSVVGTTQFIIIINMIGKQQ